VTYTALALAGIPLALAVDLLVLRTRLVRGRLFWTAYGIVLVFQLLSNGVLTGRQVVRYDPAAIIGTRIAYAPVEDLAFGFALVLLTLSSWVWQGRRPPARGRPRDRSPAAGSPERRPPG
jgi:lycopene cyclase domain-containing protein